MSYRLPEGIVRYQGDGCDVEVDAAGKRFYAFQKQNNLGCVIMVAGGIATEVTPAQILGRPRLSCNPFIGLWVVGNQENTTDQTPPEYAIPQYTRYPLQDARIKGFLDGLAAAFRALLGM